MVLLNRFPEVAFGTRQYPVKEGPEIHKTRAITIHDKLFIFREMI